MATAAAIRTATSGTRITFSPKVFIPLTFLCNDTCGYCTFAQPPARVDEALPRPRRRARASPARAPAPAATRRCSPWANDRRTATRSPATGSANAATTRRSTTSPRWRSSSSPRPGCSRTPTPVRSTPTNSHGSGPCSPSQGMMIESVDPDLDGPPQRPRQDARTPPRHARGRRASSRSRSPPGSSSASVRAAPINSRPRSDRRQPPPPRPRAGSDRPELPAEAPHRDAAACAPARATTTSGRSPPPGSILPRRHPPAGAAEPVRRLRCAARRRHRRLGRRLTGHRRPRQPRASVARPRPPRRGHRRARASSSPPASRSIPSSSPTATRWLDPALHFPVMDRADAEWLGRDDPGQYWPEKTTAADTVADGAEFVLVGHRSTAWYSGSDHRPPTLAARRRRAAIGGAVADVLAGIDAGEEPGIDEIVTLFRARGPEVVAVAEVADRMRQDARRRHPHLGRQPEHQLHQRVHVQVQVLRVLEGSAVAQPARHAVPAHARRHRRARP